MDLTIVVILSASFLAVAGVVYVAAQFVERRIELRQRLPSGASTSALQMQAGRQSALAALVTDTFTEDRFGVDSNLRQKLRRQLLRAGFFGPYAIRYYVFARFCSVVMFPLAVFMLFELFLPGLPFALAMSAVLIAAVLGVLGPDAYLSRKQSNLKQKYRIIFPDLLDLLNICISAGLSVEASFDRVRDHIRKRNRPLGRNIELLGAEMRAGRSTVEALNSFADRLGLDEAVSFVAVLRYSVELGGDVAASLRVFSEDMRVKRMLLAEMKANELPVKIVFPLALGIFPVILMIVLLPIILKLLLIMKIEG